MGIAWAASWVGGHPAAGLVSFLIMAGFGSVFVLGRRRESIRMMAAGRAADERWRSIDLRATAISGLVLITVVIAAFLWEIAHGRSGQPFTLLGAVAGSATCSRWSGCAGVPRNAGTEGRDRSATQMGLSGVSCIAGRPA